MRSRALCPTLVLILVLGGLGAAGAAATDDLAEIRAGLEERFELLPLSDGVLLQARDQGSGPRAIEISDSIVAIDGQPVGTDELRARIGEPAASWILAAAELEDEALRALARVEEEETVVEVVDEAEDAAAAAEAEAEAEAETEEDERAPRRAERRRRTGDSEVAFAGNLTVEKDEITEDVLVVGGVLTVEGRVDGNATVMGGTARIEGEVYGDVTAIGGAVRLEDGSYVSGDATSVGGRVFREDGARVDGTVEQVPFNADLKFGPWTDWRRWQSYGEHRHFDFNPWGWWTGVGWKLVRLLFVAGLAWLSLIVARGPIDRMERRIEAEPWKTGLVGLLAQVLFFPTVIVLAIFLAISIIGIPLLLVLPFALFALVVVAWLGLVAVAGRVGSWAQERFGWNLGNPFWVVLVGFGLLAGLSIVGQLLDFGVAPMRFIAAMFLFFGGVVSFAAWTIACGAAVLTRFGTADSWSRDDDFAPPASPPPPPPTGTAPAVGTADDPLDWGDDVPPAEPDEPAPAEDEEAE